MKTNIKEKPREFSVGNSKQNKITIKDCGTICLQPDEQVTFITEDNKEYDVARKDWGFYATPSINSRLKNFGLKTVLVKNLIGYKYVWLVEEGKEAAFERYLHLEDHQILQWLSDDEPNENTCLCGSNNFKKVYTYLKPPVGEMPYDLQGKAYKRELLECILCKHYILKHDYNLEKIYTGQYTTSTYKDKMFSTFKKIMNLPSNQSDNQDRVKTIIAYCDKYFNNRSISTLDVGSGLCVFLALLSQRTDWKLLALDPDPLQVEHAQEVCKINSVCSEFSEFHSVQKFDLITFNKVLEHVADPIKMLNMAKKNLAENGLVYIELPDGTQSLRENPLREEFFLEHYHAFSMSSINILIEKAGLITLHTERLKEPSGKYTLRAFCTC